MSYVPAGKVESTKPPVSFVLTSRDSFVSRWVTLTVAPGTAAPDEAVTLPTIEPKRTCASATRPANAVKIRPRNASDHASLQLDFRCERFQNGARFNRYFDMDNPFSPIQDSAIQIAGAASAPLPPSLYIGPELPSI